MQRQFCYIRCFRRARVCFYSKLLGNYLHWSFVVFRRLEIFNYWLEAGNWLQDTRKTHSEQNVYSPSFLYTQQRQGSVPFLDNFDDHHPEFQAKAAQHKLLLLTFIYGHEQLVNPVALPTPKAIGPQVIEH